MRYSYCSLPFVAAFTLTTAAPFRSTNPTYGLFERQSQPAEIFSCSASSWPPNLIGKANVPQEVSSDVASILGQVSPANIEASILKLVSFENRHTLSVQDNATYGIGGARDWLQQEFQRYAAASDGKLTVEVVGYEQQPDGDRILFPVRISDVVATLHGTESPERLYVVSGHYDTRCSDPNDYTSPQPGADDDASGVAVSLELARVMSQPNFPRPKATIQFVAVAGEEQGLYGAQYLAQTYANSTPRVNVEGMFTNDIIGSPKADDGYIDPYVIRLFGQGLPNLATENATVRASRLTVGGENDTPARNLARFVKEVSENEQTGMNVSVVYRLDRYLRGGDHRPFLEAGYPAARFTEPAEDYAHQHQDVRVEDGV